MKHIRIVFALPFHIFGINLHKTDDSLQLIFIFKNHLKTSDYEKIYP